MTHQHAGRYVLKKPVFFIGFMGAGKTSVSQQIAVTCGVASIDADEYLEFREDRIIADIFAEDGEEAFRDIVSPLKTISYLDFPIYPDRRILNNYRFRITNY